MAYTGNKPTNVVDVSETQSLTVDGDLTVDTDTLKADSANNRVGVGTASPVAPLHVKAATDVHVGIDDSSSDALIFAANDASATAVVPLKFQANSFKFNGSSEFVRIADDGKVGIGTSSPSHTLNVAGTGARIYLTGANEDIDMDSSANGQLSLDGNGYAGAIALNASGMRLYHNSSSLPLIFGTNETERMRIDGNGNILFGVTATGNNGAFFSPASNDRTALFLGTSTTSSSTLQVFRNSNGTVGAISVSGSATAYATSSDYRLKENVTSITDGITRVKQLKPSRFNFKSDADTNVDGFLAHEAQTVVPEAVTGTKDETEAIGDLKDADGNVLESKVVKPENLADGRTWTETGTQPVYQGIDQAKLVPILTAALQEAIAKIETLETKVAALEAG
tara:strand:+ start:603 stop:1787 length:1185 start_codon:yes stop_codon:yes gene_type:complete